MTWISYIGIHWPHFNWKTHISQPQLYNPCVKLLYLPHYIIEFRTSYKKEELSCLGCKSGLVSDILRASVSMIDLTSCLKYFHPVCFCPPGLWKHDGVGPETSKGSLRSLPAKTHSWDMFLPLCQESQLLANRGHQLQSFPPLRPLKRHVSRWVPHTLTNTISRL